MNEEDHIHSIGLWRHASSAPSIGGILRSRTEDFRVDEISKHPSLDPRGRFTLIRATLKNWETHRFITKLAQAVGISKQRIWFAGTKDKRAVTSQLFTVDAPVRVVELVGLNDVDIEVIGRTHQKMSLGGHQANRFSIVVRGCCDEHGVPIDSDEAKNRVEEAKKVLSDLCGPNAVPNWVGPQRFGAGRPVTHAVGRALVEDDPMGAINIYVGAEGPHESEEVAAFRAKWRDGCDANDALSDIPKHLNYERMLLERLAQKPEDPWSAIHRLPNSLRTMMIHAVQSGIFNHWLAHRLERGWSLVEPMVGDVVCALDKDGRADRSRAIIAAEHRLDWLAHQCRSGRATITGPLPGTDSTAAEGEPGELEKAVIHNLGLGDLDWSMPHRPSLSPRGGRRAATMVADGLEVTPSPSLSDMSLGERWTDGPSEGERWSREGGCLRFRFELPPGGYATSALREFMQVPTRQYG
ncbi:MAG: tRNA pseudouridine(13) synthase TruD [Euryarchaeota archaeon]|nr:tRNA pseudouridine(13) synthase TruD [Euryarchaeota archaeon]